MTTITAALVEAPNGAPGTLAAQRDTLLPKLVLEEVGVGKQHTRGSYSDDH